MMPKEARYSAEVYPAYKRATETRLLVETDPVASLLINLAIETIETKYGPESPNPKPYHNTEHTIGVINAASHLADAALRKNMIRPHDKNLLLIAAAYHDTEQDKGSGDNEHASAKLALGSMKEFGDFLAEDCHLVRTAIMGTQVYSDGAGVMHQMAKSGNYLSQLLADADLAAIGQPTEIYQATAINLFRELHPDELLGGESYNQFLVGQSNFLANHNFFTSIADELFPNKYANQTTAFPNVSNFVN